MSSTSTLGPSATLPSSLSSCSTGQLPDLSGGSTRVCAIGVYSDSQSAQDSVDAMRSCCGDATINIIDGGCGLSCNAGDDTQSCLEGKIDGLECSGGSTDITVSGSGDSGQTISGGGNIIGMTFTSGGATSAPGQTISAGNGQTIIAGGGTTTTIGSSSTAGSPSGTTATGASASHSTGAAPQVRLDFASKGGVFVGGLLAMGFFSGVLLL